MKLGIGGVSRKCMGAGFAVLCGGALVAACNGVALVAAMPTGTHTSTTRTQVAIDVAGLAVSISIVVGKEGQ